jgi:hypothetical protein
MTGPFFQTSDAEQVFDPYRIFAKGIGKGIAITNFEETNDFILPG